MASIALAPCITQPSAAAALAMQGNGVLVIHKVGIQIPAPSKWKVSENKFNMPRVKKHISQHKIWKCSGNWSWKLIEDDVSKIGALWSGTN